MTQIIEKELWDRAWKEMHETDIGNEFDYRGIRDDYRVDWGGEFAIYGSLGRYPGKYPSAVVSPVIQVNQWLIMHKIEALNDEVLYRGNIEWDTETNRICINQYSAWPEYNIDGPNDGKSILKNGVEYDEDDEEENEE